MLLSKRLVAIDGAGDALAISRLIGVMAQSKNETFEV
jgi:hypothetical protein